MSSDKGKPWDGALDAVSKQLDEASKSVRDAAAGPVKQARDVVRGEVDHAKELTSSARHAINESATQAWEATKTFVGPVVDVFKQADGDEGTALRKHFGVAREQVNRQLYAAQQQLDDAKKLANGQMVPVKGALALAQHQMLKANEFRREHPEVAAAGLAVIVGVPSLLIRGKWSAVRNSVVVVGAGALACYGSDKWAEKKRKEQQNLPAGEYCSFINCSTVSAQKAEFIPGKAEYGALLQVASRVLPVIPLAPMTDLSPRECISQWTYDHSQDRDDLQHDPTIQWLGVERVAELMRQRHLEFERGAIDFEARVASLETQYFPTRRNDNHDCKTSNETRNATRLRPQSASLAHRSDALTGSKHGTPTQPRPQSAKTRSDAPKENPAVETKGNVAWKCSPEEKVTKWREMLARGPEFKQLTLRKLEIETYELLYKTLQQARPELSSKTSRRRRRQRGNGSTSRTNSRDNPDVACGSGIRLARSRKKRQQEHDRRMMQGKGQRSPCPRDNPDQYANRSNDDKRVIQERTRKRNKLLKKKPRTEVYSQETNHDTRQDKEQQRQHYQVYSRGRSPVRAPWIPSGSSKSLEIRGITPEVNEPQAAQDKRFTRVSEAFRSDADAHMKQVRKAMNKSSPLQSRPASANLLKADSIASARRNQHGSPKSARIGITTRADLGAFGVSKSKSHQTLGKYSKGDSLVMVDAKPSLQRAISDTITCGNELSPSLMPVTPLLLPFDSFSESQPGAVSDRELADPILDDKQTYQDMPSSASDNVVLLDPVAGETSHVETTPNGQLVQQESVTLNESCTQQHKGEKSSEDHQQSCGVIEELYSVDSFIELGTTTPPMDPSPIELQEELDVTDVGIHAVDDEAASIHTAGDDKFTSLSSTHNSPIAHGEGGIPVVLSEFQKTEKEKPSVTSCGVGHHNEVAAQQDDQDETLPVNAPLYAEKEVEGATEAAAIVAPTNVEERDAPPTSEPEVDEGSAVNSTLTILQTGEAYSVISISLPTAPVEVNDSGETQPASSESTVDTSEDRGGDSILLHNDLKPSNRWLDPSIPMLGSTGNVEVSTPVENCSAPEFSSDEEVVVSQARPIDMLSDLISHPAEVGVDSPCATNKTDSDDDKVHVKDIQHRPGSTTCIDNHENGDVEGFDMLRVGGSNAVTATALPSNNSRGQGEAFSSEREEVQSVGEDITSLPLSVDLVTTESTASADAVDEKGKGLEVDNAVKATDTFDAPVTNGGDQGAACTLLVETAESTQILSLRHDIDGVRDATNVKAEKGDSIDLASEPALLCRSWSAGSTAAEAQETAGPLPTEEEVKPLPSVVGIDTVASITEANGKLEAVTEQADVNHLATAAAEPSHGAPPQEPKHPLLHVTGLDIDLDKGPVQDGTERDVAQEHVNVLHDAARKIQVQYRRFVRRRNILDQLHFLVAKHRRKTRKKTRQRSNKMKDVSDMAVTRDESSVAPVELSTSKKDGDSAEAKPSYVGLAVGDTVDPSTSSVTEVWEDGEPTISRKGSCEYVFDLFGGPREAGEEVPPNVADDVTVEEASPDEHDVGSVADPPAHGEKAAEPQATEVGGHGVGDTRKCQKDTAISFEQRTVKVTVALDPDVRPSTPTVIADLSMAKLLELAFADDVEDEMPQASKIVTAAAAVAEPRYADSSTSKPRYLDKSTIESQTTTPEGGLTVDKAQPSGPHAASTTPPQAAAAATDVAAFVPPSEQPEPTREEPLGTWREFLDEASGQMFYYNTKTGESSWTPPKEVVASSPRAATAASSAAAASTPNSSWVMYIDPASQAPYYVNVETLATTWELPDEIASRVALGESNVAAADDYTIAIDDQHGDTLAPV